MAENHRPGLPSLNEARAERRRQLATGRAKIGGLPPQFFLWGGLVLVTFFVAYYRVSQSDLEKARNALMAKQRAVATTLGPKLLPIRDKVEAAAQELAKAEYPGDFVAPGLELDKLVDTPALYLRLRMEDAGDVERLRKAATTSLRDGFTSCLFRDLRAGSPSEGTACRESNQCSPGEICTEFNVCQRPTQPFNMRLLYRALHVLSSKWTDEVHQARNELALSAYDGGLDSVTRVDIPVAIEVFQRAKIVALVLDEPPAGGLPEELPEVEETEQERLQRSQHFARVGVFDLKTGEPLLRLRTEAAGELRDLGTRRGVPAVSVQAARQRQANSCALALEVKRRVEESQRSSSAAAGEPQAGEGNADKGAEEPSAPGASPSSAAPSAAAPSGAAPQAPSGAPAQPAAPPSP